MILQTLTSGKAARNLAVSDLVLIHTTAQSVQIFAEQGSKSANDFIVRYREPGGRVRTPKHIHMVIDLLLKRAGNRALTQQFLDYLVQSVCLQVRPSEGNPPALQIYNQQRIADFAGLNEHGEYSVEFLLVTVELIQTQEITNYPNGHGHYGLYQMLRDGANIFKIVGAATR